MKDYKLWILEELESWCHTFNTQYPEHMEEVIEQEDRGYEYIQYLMLKYEEGKCEKEDYENILFHLWQALAFTS